MTATAITPRAGRWLYGPAPDLLFGCGLLYALLFSAFAVFGPSLRAHQPEYLVPLLMVLVSNSHYGGTLVRVYAERADRRSYAIFSVWATLLLAGLLVWGTFASVVASWLFTIYITWSPWHYTGQNYGLAVMFLRRRGVPLTPGTQRVLHASFVLAYLLTFLVLHSALGVINYSGVAASDSRVVFLPLGIPLAVDQIVFPLAVAAYAASLVASAVLLLRRARARDLVPAAALVLTQALWFSLPFGVRYFGVSTGVEPIDLQNQIRDYILWVALGHGAQYLWVTSYYARGGPGWHGFARYFGKTLASGVAVWMLPVFAFAPVTRGRFEYAGGLGLLVASIVNIHHFILDGAIWKLRDTKIASVLIRAEPERAAGLREPVVRERPWLRRAVWGVATAGLAIGLYAFWLENIAWAGALVSGNSTAAGSVLDRMAWLGHDSSAGRVVAARSAARAKDAREAEVQLRRAFQLQPSAHILMQIGDLRADASDWQAALAAYEDALALAPDDSVLLERTARSSSRLGRLDKARALLERELELQPNSAALHVRVAQLAKQRGDLNAATQHQRQALALAPGGPALRNDLARTLATSSDPRIRDPEEAIRLVEPLVIETPVPDVNWLDTLAAAYAAAGRFEDAVRVASRAVALADAQGLPELRDEIRAHLALYREQRPYVEAEPPNGS